MRRERKRIRPRRRAQTSCPGGPQPQKPASDTCGCPSIISQVSVGPSVMHAQSAQLGSRGVQTYSIPSVGPQREVQVWSARHVPAPQAYERHAKQSATGPGCHVPPSQTIAVSQHASPQLAPSSLHPTPSQPEVVTGHSPGGVVGHTIAGHAAGSQWPPVHCIAGQPVPPGVGQHSPQLAPSMLHASPTLGCRPHQHTGSGSAIAQFQWPLVHVHDIAELHTLLPPLEQVEPSGEHAERGSVGSHGLKSVGHVVGPQFHVVPSQRQLGPGGGPRQVGPHVD